MRTMICKNCQKETKTRRGFCTGCGKSLKDAVGKTYQYSWKSIFYTFLRYCFVVIFIIGFIVAAIEDRAVNKNNQALEDLNKGDFNASIEQLKTAVETAPTDELKGQILTNLGYAYYNADRFEEATETFKEAIRYVSQESFEYLLLSGEVAELENMPAIALAHYLRAYEKKPTSFQVNTSLGLIYLDLEDKNPALFDPEKALNHLQRAYDSRDDFMTNIASHNLGNAHLVNGNYQEAIDVLSDPSVTLTPIGNGIIGYCYYWLYEPEKSKPHFEKYIDAGFEIEDFIYEELFGQAEDDLNWFKSFDEA